MVRGGTRVWYLVPGSSRAYRYPGLSETRAVARYRYLFTTMTHHACATFLVAFSRFLPVPVLVPGTWYQGTGSPFIWWENERTSLWWLPGVKQVTMSSQLLFFGVNVVRKKDHDSALINSALLPMQLPGNWYLHCWSLPTMYMTAQ